VSGVKIDACHQSGEARSSWFGYRSRAVAASVTCRSHEPAIGEGAVSVAQGGPNHRFNCSILDHLFRVATCLDGLENGSHVSVAETERARLAIERVANIEQWRGDARLASRFGD